MSKGISLHIGVNKLSLLAYEKDGALSSPANDAQVMAQIAEVEGFEKIELLLNENATKDNFLNKFEEYVRLLKSGDTFLLTFSGHGGQTEDDGGDEEDGKDETWCFYDGELIDDKLGEKWKEFKKGVRIIVVSSSCHSRTAIRPYDTDSFSQNASGFKYKKEILQNGKSILSSYLHDPEVLASIIHISACEDSKEARDGENLSVFTQLLHKYWDEGRFSGNYEDLVKKIRSESGYNQKAGITTLGNNDLELLNSRPFELLTK